tara:strand:- start:1729 stop:2115 length:387 start_codon:yes stop_codon:yes gene_type:complete
MIEIGKKIMLQKREAVNTNADEFMRELHSKIETSDTNRQTFLTSLVMVFMVLLLTVTQFGAPNIELDNYLLSRTEYLIETDFWNVNIDSLENEQEYFHNMAYFLMDEGYVWEAIELLDQLKLEEEKSL